MRFSVRDGRTARGNPFGLFGLDIARCYNEAKECAEKECRDFEHGHECDTTCTAMVYDEFLGDFY
jgi:hypothetical protein